MIKAREIILDIIGCNTLQINDYDFFLASQAFVVSINTKLYTDKQSNNLIAG